MTTTTTGTPSPQVRNIILAVAALGLVAFIALNQGFSTNTVTSQQTAETAVATLPESVTGFEYDHEVTSGRIASEGVTGQHFGYNPEFDVPESDAKALEEAAESGGAEALEWPPFWTASGVVVSTVKPPLIDGWNPPVSAKAPLIDGWHQQWSNNQT